jgi:regulator of Ty1 transposition protein 103
MNTGFSSEAFAQKLAKLNISQQSIETLSHWCVFHHRCCQQVVETWDRDFHSAPQERKISLLYLANDIMQNSKKDGMRYIHKFFKVIAAALDDLFTNGDEYGRNVIQRLVDIWEDRKLFGTQGQLLKEKYTRKFKELKSEKKPGGELMEKVISSYKHMLHAPIDEDKLMRKCNSALSFVDNLNKEYGNSHLGKMYVY